MAKVEVVLAEKTEFSSRFAGKFVKKASSFKSQVTVVKNGKEYSGKSIMGILTIGALNGDRIFVKAEGTDEEEAIKALVDLLRKDFHSEGKTS